jgi:glycine betaine/proline transport system permease protein
LESWFTVWKLPLGRLAKQGITWLQDNAAGFFDVVTWVIDTSVDGLTRALSAVPVAVLIFGFAALAYWLHRSWRLTAFVVAAFLHITNLG